MPRVKFLKDSVHPDHGYVEQGEILLVGREYVKDYEALGIAQETDDEPTRAKDAPAVLEMPEGMAKREAKAGE